MVAIKSKINVLRALSSVVAKKAVTLFVFVSSIVLAILLIGIFLLAYFLSSWWWLLLIVFVPLVLVATLTYLIAAIIASRLAPTTLSREQKLHLSEFTDKILRLLETRGMGWWWFFALCIRDLLVYRELRMLKSLIQDTASLKRDFTALENEIN